MCATNGFKAWVLQEYEARVHVMKEKEANKWEVDVKKEFSQKEFLLFVKKESGYPLNEKALRDWKAKGLEFFLTTKREQKSVGSGRKTQFAQLEGNIHSWIQSRWAMCRPPTVSEVMGYAEKEVAQLPPDAARFKVTRDWYERFASRHDLRLRKPSFKKYLPKFILEKQTKFLAFGIKYQRKFGEDVIFVNGDQTRIYYAGQEYGKVVAQPGRNDTANQLCNASDAAKGVTLMLTIDSQGRKFPPWVIFAGKGENPGIKIRRQLSALSENPGWSQVWNLEF